MDVVARVVPSQ
ncbi:Permeases of the major facilitator superfamily [Caballeronia sordidicola]|uniref:Permeases of the major facilitator superfamily n=1 Tax=Caballeronia sordidicola TaxID=196367 RepID=A0A242NA95_CABSO|nr:Permeases of the major facilitator superfamily [Caballeronia sordidicola]